MYPRVVGLVMPVRVQLAFTANHEYLAAAPGNRGIRAFIPQAGQEGKGKGAVREFVRRELPEPIQEIIQAVRRVYDDRRRSTPGGIKRLAAGVEELPHAGLDQQPLTVLQNKLRLEIRTHLAPPNLLPLAGRQRQTEPRILALIGVRP